MKLPKFSTNWFYVALTATFAVSIVLRLWNVDRPVADWHSWRQSDTAAVARNFIKFGFDPLRPRFDDVSNIPSGLDNPMGWRMVEFPLYQFISAGLFSFFGFTSIEVWLRIVTIVASSLTAVLLGLILGRLDKPLVGVLAAVVYAVLPYSVYYGRTILPDPFMVFWAVFAVYLLVISDNRYLILSAICAGVALLVKPFAVFLLLPIPYLLLKRFSFSRLL
ncbi:MAG: glycosyltransferase family 39 protein, partial [Patescibacteria group bacterium]